MSVPESDVTVSCTTTRCKEPVLVGTPSYGLDCSCVVVELGERLVRVQVPYHQFIIVAS